MTTVRAPHDAQNPFVQVARCSAQDARLSYEARGVLAYLLSKPDDWRIEPDDLICAECGRDKVYRILKELVTAGYLRRDKVQGKGGRWSWMPYQLRETSTVPYPENPDTVQPDTDIPYTASPDTVSPYTEKPEIKESLVFKSLSSKTEQQKTEKTGEGASAPPPAAKPVTAKRAPKEPKASPLQVIAAHPMVKAYTDAFEANGMAAPIVVKGWGVFAAQLDRAGYTADQVRSLVEAKLYGGKNDYQFRYVVEDIAAFVNASRVAPRKAMPSPIPPANSRYNRPPTPELYRKVNA